MTQLGQVGKPAGSCSSAYSKCRVPNSTESLGHDWTAVPIGKRATSKSAVVTHTAERCWHISLCVSGSYLVRNTRFVPVADSCLQIDTHASAKRLSAQQLVSELQVDFFFPSDADARREQSDFSGPVTGSRRSSRWHFCRLQYGAQSSNDV